MNRLHTLQGYGLGEDVTYAIADIQATLDKYGDNLAIPLSALLTDEANAEFNKLPDPSDPSYAAAKAKVDRLDALAGSLGNKHVGDMTDEEANLVGQIIHEHLPDILLQAMVGQSAYGLPENADKVRNQLIEIGVAPEHIDAAAAHGVEIASQGAPLPPGVPDPKGKMSQKSLLAIAALAVGAWFAFKG